MANENEFTFFPQRTGQERSYLPSMDIGETWMLGTDAMHRSYQKRLARERAMGRQRATTVATEPAVDAWQPTAPALLTGFDLGEFQYDRWPGQLVLPEITVQPLVSANGSMTIEIPQWGNEQFVIPQAERGIGAGYNTVTTDPTTVTSKLDFYGLAAKKDIRVVNKADSFLDISGKHAALALRGLMLHRETRVRNLILDVSGYTAGHAVALTTEWDDASGDSKADFDSLFTVMLASSGIARENMSVILTSYDSFDAALNDPTFIAQRTSTLGTSPNTATLLELARYWRVRRVLVADCRAEIGGVIQSLWGDNAVVTWMGDNISPIDSNLTLEDFMGTPFLGGTFVANPGIAQAPYLSRDGNRTEMIWPVDSADTLFITSRSVLGLLTNVKA